MPAGGVAAVGGACRGGDTLAVPAPDIPLGWLPFALFMGDWPMRLRAAHSPQAGRPVQNLLPAV